MRAHSSGVAVLQAVAVEFLPRVYLPSSFFCQNERCGCSRLYLVVFANAATTGACGGTFVCLAARLVCVCRCLFDIRRLCTT
jgi:hypothetical protein